VKFLPAQLSYFVETAMRRNLRLLIRFIAILVVLTTAYSILFHVIMEYEGRDHSWVTGLYWTLTVMSTLGFLYRLIGALTAMGITVLTTMELPQDDDSSGSRRT